jgi:hypothetical protein
VGVGLDVGGEIGAGVDGAGVEGEAVVKMGGVPVVEAAVVKPIDDPKLRRGKG